MRQLIKNFYIPLIIAIITTCFFTFPLILNLNNFYPTFGDYPFQSWLMWYNQESIKTGRIFNQQLYFNAPQFYPFPFTLAFSDHLFLASLFFSPLYWLSHNLVLSTNLLIFIFFILTFISAYYSFKFFLKNNYATLIATLIFTFNPLTFEHLNAGHLSYLLKFFLPPVFIFLYKFIREQNVKNSFYLLLFFTLNALTTIYFLIYTLLTCTIFLLPIFIVNFFTTRAKSLWKILFISILSLPFLVVLFYFNYPYLKFSYQEQVSRTLRENIFYSAQPIDWVSSLPTNLVYGDLVKGFEKYRYPIEIDKKFHYDEHVLFLNLIPILLTILGVYYLYKVKTSFFHLNFLIIILLLSLLMSNGPFLSPTFFLYKYIFILNATRVPTRFEFIFYIPFALLAGYGVSFLLDFFHRYRLSKSKSLALILIIFILWGLENINFWNFNDRSRIIQEFAQNSKQLNYIKQFNSRVVLHIPTFSQPILLSKSAYYLTWSIFTQEKLMNGSSGYFPFEWRSLLSSINENPTMEALMKLKVLGLNHIVVHKKLLTENFPNKLSEIFNNKDLQEIKVYEDDDLLIYSLENIKKLPVCKLDSQTIFNSLKKNDFIAKTNKTSNYIFINKKDCYLVFLYEDRYQKLDGYYLDKKYIGELKFPLLISPFENATISGIFTLKN